nr:hypothetical protein GCM10025732_30910 [Glycomyces mayteni]
MHTTPRVVIVGGGFAGLETAFTLRSHLGKRVDLLLIADQHDFVFKPNSIYLPFGGDEDKLHVPITEPATRRDITLIRGSLARVDAEGHRIELDDGTLEHYDYLVLATGAAMRPEEIPGLASHARTIWTPTRCTSSAPTWSGCGSGPRAVRSRTCCSSCRRATSAPDRSTRSCSCWRPGCAAGTCATWSA